MKRLLIVGDNCLDVDIHGVCERFAQEASGCPVHREVWRESRPGMAGAVAVMCRRFDTHASLITGLAHSVKTRFLVDGRQVWRHDRDADRLSAADVAYMADSVAQSIAFADAVLVVDYGKGACTYPVVRAAIRGANLRGIPCLVDPASGVDWRTYRHATVIKCNRLEFEQARRDHHSITQWWEAHVDNVIVTEGSNGMTHYVRGMGPNHYPGVHASDVVDVTGAGDMALAALGCAIALGADWPEAIRFANASAAAKISLRGAVPLPAGCQVVNTLAAF